MEKLKLHTANLTDTNIARIRELFPNCVTEVKDDAGTVTLKVDFDQLRQELSNEIVEGPQERYRLDWPGKRESLFKAAAPIAKTFRPQATESVDFSDTANVFIDGDNLEALKLLQESYLGAIKVIYIDPPYNTGTDFLYADTFAETKTEYLRRSLQEDGGGNKLVANPDTKGRFHSDWLTTIYSRIKLARNLLREDGVLFISIDDWEVGNLRVICDEIFGRENFIGLFCRRTKSGGGSAAGTCAVEHDYILAFAKNNAEAKPLVTEFDENYLQRYKEVDDKGPFFWDTMERSSTATRPYKIDAPDGSILEGKWFRSEDTFKKDLKAGEVRFLKKEDGWSVQFKQRLSDGKKLRTILEESDLTDKKFRSLNKELEDLVGCSLGHPPKPVALMETLISSVTPKGGRDIVLDFFAGSGTTAHATINLNARDGGNRRFILVQLAEPCDPESEAFKNGYATITELAKARIRKAGSLATASESNSGWRKDVGFRVLKIDTSNMADVFYTPDATKQADLLGSVDNIKPGRDNPEDLLFQVLVDWGIDLSLPIRTEVISGKRVLFVNTEPYDLIACFDTGITEDLVKTLAAYQPMRMVFRDNGFASDAVKINVDQIFARLSPDTEVKSI